jgi:hypothetical protein
VSVNYNDSPDDLFLEVGGKNFKVHSSVFLQFKQTKIAEYFRETGKLEWRKGRIIVDRDSEVFELLIDFLKSGCLEKPEIKSKTLRKAFKAELEYWGLNNPLMPESKTIEERNAQNFEKLMQEERFREGNKTQAC